MLSDHSSYNSKLGLPFLVGEFIGGAGANALAYLFSEGQQLDCLPVCGVSGVAVY